MCAHSKQNILEVSSISDIRLSKCQVFYITFLKSSRLETCHLQQLSLTPYIKFVTQTYRLSLHYDTEIAHSLFLKLELLGTLCIQVPPTSPGPTPHSQPPGELFHSRILSLPPVAFWSRSRYPNSCHNLVLSAHFRGPFISEQVFIFYIRLADLNL